MKKHLWILSILALSALVFGSLTLCVKAHPGRTDGNGGHTNRSTGEYHYHHGYSAHDHYDMNSDGVKDCPYDFDDKTEHNHSSKSAKKRKESLSFGVIIAFGLYVFFMFILPFLY